MSEYLLINATISSSVLLALLLLRSAPPRLRIALGMTAVVLWLLPLHRLPLDLPVAEPLKLRLPDMVSQADAPLPQASGEATALMGFSKKNVDPGRLFLLVLIPGSLLFALRLAGYAITVVRQKKRSRDGHHLWSRVPEESRAPAVPIRILDSLEGGMATGLIRPTIWVGARHADGDAITALILHELTHIRHRDHYILLVLNLTQCLLWWNPLVHLLARGVRFHLELDCDAACKKRLPSGVYQAQLAHLLLELQSRPVPRAHLATGIFNPKNLKRIRELERSFSMQPTHHLVTALLLAFSALTLLQAGPAAKREPGGVLEKQKPAAQAREAKEYRGFKIDIIDIKDQPVADLLRFIADQVGLNLYLDASVSENMKVTYTFRDMPWDQVLDIAIEDTGLFSDYAAGVLWVGTEEAARRMGRMATLGEAELKPLVANPLLGKRFSGSELSLDTKGTATVAAVLAEIAEHADLNIYLHPAAADLEARYQLKNMPWDQALDIVLQNAGLTFRMANHNLWVGPVSVYRALGSPDQYPSYVGKPIDVDLRDERLASWLGSLAAAQGLRLETEKGGTLGDIRINYAFVDTPWDQALDIVLANANARAYINDGVLTVLALD